jgi:muramoyltetrapeptide carboxypeptidase
MKVYILFILITHIYANLIKPPKLKNGMSMGLISPASPYSYLESNITEYLLNLKEVMLNEFNFSKIFYGKHMNDTYGYLAGIDQHRADDIHFMFQNPEVNFILSNRGGFGCIRILDKLDYSLIKRNPKIIMGYSDLTALLNAIHIQTGLITFYGPMGIDNWKNLNSYYFKKIAFEGEAIMLKNPPQFNKTITIHGKKF